MSPATTYILIDYENVQPTDLAAIQNGFKVKLFLGANQTKIPVSFAVAIQRMGENAEYVQLESTGPNALDFHIAYYIGRISAVEPKAAFQIISNDAGFDPLIVHLKAKGITVHRSVSISSAVDVPDLDSWFEIVVDHLARQNGSKPTSKKTLLNLIRTLFKKKLSEGEVNLLLRTLCDRKIVRIEGSQVAYEIPEDGKDVPF
jgi:hypothetical protein